MDAIRSIAKEAKGRKFKKQLVSKMNQEMALERMRKEQLELMEEIRQPLNWLTSYKKIEHKKRMTLFDQVTFINTLYHTLDN